MSVVMEQRTGSRKTGALTSGLGTQILKVAVFPVSEKQVSHNVVNVLQARPRFQWRFLNEDSHPEVVGTKALEAVENLENRNSARPTILPCCEGRAAPIRHGVPPRLESGGRSVALVALTSVACTPPSTAPRRQQAGRKRQRGVTLRPRPPRHFDPSVHIEGTRAVKGVVHWIVRGRRWVRYRGAEK